MSKEFKVGALSTLKPGQLKAVTVDGRQLLIANVEGEIYATDEMCTHEEWSLANGALKGDCVECPLHGSRFSLKTGAPLEEPATEALRTYPTRVEGEDIFVTLD
jgi:3-phenylpropionate/trans-cinnamate dioxygenase ferredoxin subunit